MDPSGPFTVTHPDIWVTLVTYRYWKQWSTVYVLRFYMDTSGPPLMSDSSRHLGHLGDLLVLILR